VTSGGAGRRHDIALGVHEAALPGRDDPLQSRAASERLMDQTREANERLIIAAMQAQNQSEEAHAETAQLRSELEDLMRQLEEANVRLAAAAARAHIMAEAARRRQDEYRDLSGRLLQLQDDERRRLAVDLHDSMGQRLAALMMNLDLVGGANPGLDRPSRRALEESRSLAEQCCREVRTLAYLLHPPLLDEMGLVSAVRWYATGFTKRSGIHVVLSLDAIGRLPKPIETALFRIVQESLTNVHRHASASTASIRLTTTANTVVLDIKDQGLGLRGVLVRRKRTLQPLGVGIQGMRERIRQLGGSFTVEFTDKGTAVRVGVPLGKRRPRIRSASSHHPMSGRLRP
jgi:signal transduction histidine kinase